MESEMKPRDSTATTIVKQLGMVGLSFSKIVHTLRHYKRGK